MAGSQCQEGKALVHSIILSRRSRSQLLPMPWPARRLLQYEQPSFSLLSMTLTEFTMKGFRAFLAFLILGLLSTGWLQGAPDAEQAKTLARLGKERVEAARKTYQVMWTNYREGRYPADTLYRWSVRWLDADRQLSDQAADQLAAYKTHFERMRELERLVISVNRAGQATVDEVSSAEFYRAEAELWYLQARIGK